VLECLDGYGFDTQKNECVAPNCGSLVFDPQQGVCVPPPPILCPPGQKYNFQQKQCVAEIYAILQFVVGTGGDDLRGSSIAWASWTDPAGNTAYCLLHAGGDAWDNNSSHTVPCDLGGAPMTLAQLQTTKFTIAYNGAIPPDTYFTSVDNWNLQSVTINAVNEGERPVCVFSASGDPLHRFQDVDQQNNLDQPVNGPGDIGSYDHIVVTDYPGRCA
jgi:hypothetical protein